MVKLGSILLTKRKNREKENDMVLSDLDILERLNQPGGIAITPLGDKALQSCSVDLRLGNKFKRGIQDIELTKGEKLTLQPGDFVLGATLESVGIPLDLVGQLDGRSGLGRQGLAVHITASRVDPGFKGQLTLELVNLNSEPISLTPGMAICSLMLEQLTNPTGNGYKGSYANQSGPVSSRLALENKADRELKAELEKELRLSVNYDLVLLLVHASRDSNRDMATIAKANLAAIFGNFDGETWLAFGNSQYTVKRDGSGKLVIVIEIKGGTIMLSGFETTLSEVSNHGR
jgi:dCTP deaminase